MELRVPSWLKWLAGLLATGLIYSAIEQSTPAVWLRETGGPALEAVVWSALTSPWAASVGATLAFLLAVTAFVWLARRFLGRPRTPAEKKADLRLAAQCEELAQRLDKDASLARGPGLIFVSPTWFVRLSRLADSDFKPRAFKIESNKGDMTKAGYLEANATCLRAVAAALRKGNYKGRTFRCTLP